MLRRTFVRLLAKETGWKTGDFTLALDCIEAYIAAELRKNGKAEIPGLVNFRVRELGPRKEYYKRDFTGENAFVPAQPARKRILPRISKHFSDKVFGK